MSDVHCGPPVWVGLSLRLILDIGSLVACRLSELDISALSSNSDLLVGSSLLKFMVAKRLATVVRGEVHPRSLSLCTTFLAGDECSLGLICSTLANEDGGVSSRISGGVDSRCICGCGEIIFGEVVGVQSGAFMPSVSDTEELLRFLLRVHGFGVVGGVCIEVMSMSW